MFGNGKKSITQEEHESLQSQLISRLDKLEALVKSQDEQIGNLQQEISRLSILCNDKMEKKSDMDMAKPSNESLATLRREASKASPHRLQATTQTFYLPAPDSDGFFPETSRHEQVGKSIYQLTTEDGVNGYFKMLDSRDAIATAMLSISEFVKPACRIEGNTRQQAYQIETLEAGTARKEGALWRVTGKAKVLFR